MCGHTLKLFHLIKTNKKIMQKNASFAKNVIVEMCKN